MLHNNRPHCFNMESRLCTRFHKLNTVLISQLAKKRERGREREEEGREGGKEEGREGKRNKEESDIMPISCNFHY